MLHSLSCARDPGVRTRWITVLYFFGEGGGDDGVSLSQRLRFVLTILALYKSVCMYVYRGKKFDTAEQLKQATALCFIGHCRLQFIYRGIPIGLHEERQRAACCCV